MSDNNFRKERVKNALDNRKLNLSAPTPGHQGKKASLIWGLYSNNPRITVYTGDPNDQDASKGYGKISANLDAPTFFAFLEMLQTAANPATPADWKQKIENKNFIFPQGKRSETPVLVSELWVGKDKEGVVWISILDRNKERPRIKFEIGNNDFHRFVNGDGTPLTQGETSALYTRGYVTLLQGMMEHLLCTLWVEPEKKDNAGGGNRGGGNYGGGGGGYNRNQGGGQSASKPADDFGDTDIPF